MTNKNIERALDNSEFMTFWEEKGLGQNFELMVLMYDAWVCGWVSGLNYAQEDPIEDEGFVSIYLEN